MRLAWRTNPGQRAAAISAAKQTPEGKAISAASNRKRWSLPGQREAHIARTRKRLADPTHRAAVGAKIAAAWTPEKRKAFGEFRRRQWTEEGFRTAAVAGMARAEKSLAARAALGERNRQRARDPVLRAKWLGNLVRAMNRPEYRARQSAEAKRRWANPLFRARMRKLLAAGGPDTAGTTLRIVRTMSVQTIAPSRIVRTMSVQTIAPSLLGMAPRQAVPAPRRGFSMLAMQGPDPMREVYEWQARDYRRGRV